MSSTKVRIWQTFMFYRENWNPRPYLIWKLNENVMQSGGENECKVAK